MKVTSLKDTKHLHSKQPSGGTLLCEKESRHCKSRHMAVPCHPMVGGARSSQEILSMQPSDMDKKRETFLEHLKQKYPHHASVIISHQERLREQVSIQNAYSPAFTKNSLLVAHYHLSVNPSIDKPCWYYTYKQVAQELHFRN